MLDEPEAKAALSRAITASCAATHQAEMVRLGFTLKERTGAENSHLHWEQGVRAIFETARASGLSPDQLPESATQRVKGLLALLGPAHAEGFALDAGLRAALRAFVAAVDPEQHTAEFLTPAQAALNKLELGHALAWADWASLAHKKPQKEHCPLAESLRDAATAHDRHPRLQDELARAVTLVFKLAQDAYASYQTFKTERGLMDFTDQEVYALESPAICAELPAALAAGVHQLLADPTVRVRDRGTGRPRGVKRADVAILCASNDACAGVAAALTALGIPSQRQQTGVFATLEGCALRTALHLWRDPSAPRARAELSRLLSSTQDAEAWTNAALAEPQGATFDAEPAVQALL